MEKRFEFKPDDLSDLISSLAAYEDIVLEPEEAEQIELAFMGKALAEIKEFEGIPLSRMIELSQAEKDGRLVVLPCKVGDIVFDIQDGTPYATRVLSYSYFGDYWACRTVSSYPDLGEFGTRIFLTHEEAEAALKKRVED